MIGIFSFGDAESQSAYWQGLKLDLEGGER